MPENHEETAKCLTLREELSKLALSLGGAVAGEHGIGKLRKDLLGFESLKSSTKRRIFKALKQELDPNNLMAPGNIL